MKFKFSRFYIMAITCQIFPLLLLAQENIKQRKIAPSSGVELAIFLGGQDNSTDGLNQRLSQYGRPHPPGKVWNMGAGVRIMLGKTILGTEGSALYKAANSFADIRGSYLHAFVSRKVFGYGKILFFPELGIGSQRININARGRSSFPDFDDHLLFGPRDITFYNANIMAELAMCVRLQVADNWQSPVLRVGYRYGMKEKTWRIKYSKAQNGPIDRLSNLYVQVMFGISR